jgi:uncharacterized protein
MACGNNVVLFLDCTAPSFHSKVADKHQTRTFNVSTPLIIYHGGHCLDGFGSAYAAYHHFQNIHQQPAEFYAANHGEPPPDCLGREVYLLDFCYKRAVMETLLQQAKHVVVLDHHITAQHELENIEHAYKNISVILDMQRSGAMIAWEYFHKTPAPRLIHYIQDRDLWQHALPDSADFNAALSSHPQDFALWHQFAQDASSQQQLILEGRAINRYRTQLIEQHKRHAVLGTIAGHAVPIVNAPVAIVSELLNELAEGQPFAAGYRDRGTHRGWSLRSKPEGINVADIAAQFGGGGHARAAGFATQTTEEWLRLTPPT